MSHSNIDEMDEETISTKNSDADLSRLGRRLPQYLATVTVNMAAFAYGTVVGWPSVTLPLLQSPTSPGGGEPLSAEAASWVGALLCLGAMVGTPLYSMICERFGRKVAGYLVALPFVVSWTLLLIAQSTIMLLVARFVVGLGSGGAIYLCPMYVGETTEDSIRGQLGSYFVLFINGGILFSFLIGSYVTYHALIFMSLAIPVMFLFTFFWLPETPIYLLTKDRALDAQNSLRWLRNGIDEEAEEEMNRMTAVVKEITSSTDEKVTFKDLISSRGTRRGLLIGLALCANQQLCGIFAIISFTVSIFQEAGTDLSPNAATIIVGTVQLIGSFIAVALMDRAGRRILLIVSNIVMSNCLGVLAAYFYFKHIGYDVSAVGLVPVISLSTYILFFAIGLGPVPFIVISEIFAPKVRGIVTSVCMITIWLLAFLVTKLFSNIIDLIGSHGCYGLFSTFCTLGSIFGIYAMIETKNKSLDTILKELAGESPPKVNCELKATDTTTEVSSV